MLAARLNVLLPENFREFLHRYDQIPIFTPNLSDMRARCCPSLDAGFSG